MRSILTLTLIAAACSSPSKADAPKSATPAPVAPTPLVAATAGSTPAPVSLAVAPPAPPRNLVCEAFKGVNDKAGCVPYFTDSGERHAHTAMVTLGQQQFHCAYNNELLSVTCAEPIVIRQQPAPPPAPDAAKATKK